MTECYTSGADGFMLAEVNKWVGQTFRPRKSFELLYIDLNLKSWAPAPSLVVLVYNCTPDHKPTGDYIARDKFHTVPWTLPNQVKRVRITMTPVHLEENCYYCFVVLSYPGLGFFGYNIACDTTNSQYWRGLLIYSNDEGVTWNRYLNRDLIFNVFGTPQTLPTPPPLLIRPFVLTAFTVCNEVRMFYFYFTTSTPCHLVCEWSETEPQKQSMYRLVRGLKTTQWTRYCFQNPFLQDQLEPGDTMFHTFLWTGWAPGERRVFHFIALVDDEFSPSSTPIMQYMRGDPYESDILTLRPDAPGVRCNMQKECTPCPDHWMCVDDVIPDEWVTQVGGISKPGYRKDSYHLTVPPLLHGCITGVRVFARCVRSPLGTHGNPYTPWGSMKMSIIANSREDVWPDTGAYTEGQLVYTNWHTFNTATKWDLNPFSHSPWLPADFLGFECGLWLRRAGYAGDNQYTRCTQLYVEIYGVPVEYPFAPAFRV